MSKSIMQLDTTECYICSSRWWLEKHHVFGGANRKASEHFGLWVRLCHYCHNEPPLGVHHNKDCMLRLHQEGQKAFELYYPEEDFKSIFGKNYL